MAFAPTESRMQPDEDRCWSRRAPRGSGAVWCRQGGVRRAEWPGGGSSAAAGSSRRGLRDEDLGEVTHVALHVQRQHLESRRQAHPLASPHPQLAEAVAPLQLRVGGLDPRAPLVAFFELRRLLLDAAAGHRHVAAAELEHAHAQAPLRRALAPQRAVAALVHREARQHRLPAARRLVAHRHLSRRALQQAFARRVAKALCREHMAALFVTQIAKGEAAPTLTVAEPPDAWQHLQDYVLGRTLLVTNRGDWSPEQIVAASRMQSHNERAFRELKDPGGASMLPLRHRRDPALRAHALLVVLALMLAKVLQRRLKQAGVPVSSLAAALRPLQLVQRARVEFPAETPAALRALAADVWVPSRRSARQEELLKALKLADRRELGTTLADRLARKKAGRPRKTPLPPA